MRVIRELISGYQTALAIEFQRNHRSILEKIAMGGLHSEVLKSLGLGKLADILS